MSQPRSPRWVCSMTVGMRKEPCSWLIPIWGALGRYPPAALGVLEKGRFMVCSPSRNGTSTLHVNVCPGHEQVKGFLLAKLVLHRVEFAVFLELRFEPLRVLSAVLGHLGEALFEVCFRDLDLLLGGHRVEEEHAAHRLDGAGAHLFL